MTIKNYKPYTPSRRFMQWYDFSEITVSKPEKSLTVHLWKTWWRNSQWRVTSRFRWGWHKQLYRIIDFRWYDKLNILATVATIEYDPYRTCRIALLHYSDWEKRYVLARQWIKVWQKVFCWDKPGVDNWNRKQLKDIPDWFTVFNLELTPFSKGKAIRSAWSYATIQWRDSVTWHVIIKLQSSEVRKFHQDCFATIWKIWNEDHMNVVIWKAWRSRWMWRKAHVLGKSMNPVDHPHWWWEWHTDIGLNKGPKAFNWRRVAPWMKTRSKKKPSSKFIVTRRSKK